MSYALTRSETSMNRARRVLFKVMYKDDQDQAAQGAATRRGFLLSAFGALAGVAGLLAAGDAGAEAKPQPARPSPGPIDNIFEPMRSPKKEPRR